MINKAKDTALISIAIILAFAFGYTLRGDVMYSDMFGAKAEIMGMLK